MSVHFSSTPRNGLVRPGLRVHTNRVGEWEVENNLSVMLCSVLRYVRLVFTLVTTTKTLEGLLWTG